MAKYPLKVRSAVAMRIINFERQRFNEAVAAGFYPCAPTEISGYGRAFGEDDLITAWFFAREIEHGLPPRVAGRLACEFKEQLRIKGSPVDEIVYVRGFWGGVFTNSYDPEKPYYPGLGGDIFSRTHINVGVVRAQIRDRMEYEASIIGREETDD